MEHPQAAGRLHRTREHLEHLLDRWKSLKSQIAENKSSLERGSKEMLQRLQSELREVRRTYRAASRAWFYDLRNPVLEAGESR